MKEYKLNETEEQLGGIAQGEELNLGNTEQAENAVNSSSLPTKVSVWSKIGGFLFQEIDLNKPIVLELTPKEEKVLTEVHDFLFQEVKFPELHDFLFQEITFGKKNKEQA